MTALRHGASQLGILNHLLNAANMLHDHISIVLDVQEASGAVYPASQSLARRLKGVFLFLGRLPATKSTGFSVHRRLKIHQRLHTTTSSTPSTSLSNGSVIVRYRNPVLVISEPISAARENFETHEILQSTMSLS
jgi:hypothetical protein